jgi:hypothetical protein
MEPIRIPANWVEANGSQRKTSRPARWATELQELLHANTVG